MFWHIHNPFAKASHYKIRANNMQLTIPLHHLFSDYCVVVVVAVVVILPEL